MKQAVKPKRYRYPKHDGTVSTIELRGLPKAEKLEVMRVWFYDNYEDPAHNSPWVDGEYTYFHGGPYDARDELEGEFSGIVRDSLLDELADELNNDCDTWAGRPEYEPDYDDYPWVSTEPEAAFATTLEATKALLKVAVSSENEQHFLRLQYASVITALETFLSDFFISIILTNQHFFRKFVETNKEFAETKFSMNQVYKRTVYKRVKFRTQNDLPRRQVFFQYVMLVIELTQPLYSQCYKVRVGMFVGDEVCDLVA